MDRRLIIVITIVLVNLLGAGIVIPTLPLFAEDRFGASPFEAAIFVAVYYVMQFVAAPIMGQLSDRFGRKPVLVWSQVGTVFSFLMFIFAQPLAAFFASLNVPILSSGLFILAAARAIDGVTGGNIAAAQAYVTDVTPEDDQARMLGYIHLSYAGGFIFGPTLGGILSELGLRAPFIAAAVITVISLLATVVYLDESLPVEARDRVHSADYQRPWAQWGRMIRDPLVWFILVLSFVVNFTISQVSAIFPFFADRVIFAGQPETTVARNVGLIMGFVGLVAIIGQGFIMERAVKRLREENIIILSIAGAVISSVGFIFVSRPIFILILLVPAGLAYALGIPCGEALLVRNEHPTRRGQLIGLYNATTSLAYIVGPIIGGFLFDRFTPQTPFMFTSVLAIIALGLAFSLKSRTIQNKRLDH